MSVSFENPPNAEPDRPGAGGPPPEPLDGPEARARARLRCPGCGERLGDPGPIGPEPEAAARVVCPGCGGRFRIRRIATGSREWTATRSALMPTPIAPPPAPEPGPEPARPVPEPPAVGGLGLAARGWGLAGLRHVYGVGTHLGTAALLAVGGVVPVLGRWVRDEPIGGWSGVISTLGGVPVRDGADDPDADLGPLLRRNEAPVLFGTVAEIARRLGARPPSQIRLAYLPCCGVVAGRGSGSEALLVGLPLLQILTLGELRAVLAHELAHLARGDATGAARSARFVDGLGRGLDAAAPAAWSPLRWWAVGVHGAGSRLIGPIARGQEARADRAAAAIAGGPAAADALAKVALVQPLFREVLDAHDPDRPDGPNLYALFRTLWGRLPESLLVALRHRLLTDDRAPLDPAHPPLPDRIAAVQAYPARPAPDAPEPAARAVCDLEALEQRLHDLLFATRGPEPSVFHRAGS